MRTRPSHMNKYPPCDKCNSDQRVIRHGFKKHADKTKTQIWFCLDCRKHFMLVHRNPGWVRPDYMKKYPPCDKCSDNKRVVKSGFRKHADKTKEQVWFCLSCRKSFMLVHRSTGVIKNRPVMDKGIFRCPKCNGSEHYTYIQHARGKTRCECRGCGISWIQPFNNGVGDKNRGEV